MLFVGWVKYRFEEVHESGCAADIIRRAESSAIDEHGGPPRRKENRENWPFSR